jgi:hypothetical protein
MLKEVFKNIAEEIRSIGEPRKRWLDDVENNLQKTGLEIDPEGGQGSAWTVEPLEKNNIPSLCTK